MRQISYVKAINEALREEMQRDERVILLGEDIELSVYGPTKGLIDEFGPRRVRNTPITEQAVTGAALGASMMGLRPIVDLMQGNFLYLAMDQFANQAAKARYMFGEQVSFPVVFIAETGAFESAGAQHSDSPHSLFMHVGGLKVAIPSCPADAKGLLKAAIRDDDPVMFFEPVALLAGDKGPVPEGDVVIPLGKADVKRAGKDVTVVAIGAMLREALAAAQKLFEAGIDIEVVDPRTLVPLDRDTITASVRKTGRLIVVDEAHRTCGVASEIAALVGERCFGDLKTPVQIIASPDVPIPFSPVLEQAVIPSARRIEAGVRSLFGG